MPMTSVMTNAGLSGGQTKTVKSRTKRSQLMAQCGINPLALMFGLHDFGGSVLADDPTVTLDELCPEEIACLTPKDRAELVARAKRQPATPKPAALRTPPMPRRRIGYHPLTGEKLKLPDAPASEPKEVFVAPPTRGLLAVDLLTDADIKQELASITTEWPIIEHRLAVLGDYDEFEDHTLEPQRERLRRRQNFLADRHADLVAERSRRFDLYVDRCAMQRARAQAAESNRMVSW